MTQKPKAATPAKMGRAAATFQERWDKLFGQDTLFSADQLVAYEVVSTGSLALDYALGVGGWVMGKIVEVWGGENLGKTTLALMGIAQAQQAYPDKACAFIDVENKFDPKWASSLGVDLTRLKLARPKTAEEVADQVKLLIDSGLFSMVVLDSVGGLISSKAKEKDAGDAVVADVAKIVTRMVNIASGALIAQPAIFMIINQVRANISTYGAGTTTAGGFALKHVSFHKVKLSRTGTAPYKAKVADGDTIEVGHELAILVERNKAAPARRVALVSLMSQTTDQFGPRGVDKAQEAALLGLKRSVGAVVQNGAWFTLTTTGEKFQGLPALVQYLRSDPESVAEIRERAIASLAAEVVAIDESEPIEEGDVEFVATDDVPVEVIDDPQFETGIPPTEAIRLVTLPE